jgi:hypothetical protein
MKVSPEIENFIESERKYGRDLAMACQMGPKSYLKFFLGNISGFFPDSLFIIQENTYGKNGSLGEITDPSIIFGRIYDQMPSRSIYLEHWMPEAYNHADALNLLHSVMEK